VVFTGSGTEANHLALMSAVPGRPGRRKVLLSAVEHPSVQAQRGWMEEEGLEVRDVPVLPSGGLDLEALRGLLGPDVAAVSVMAAHNETGVLMDLKSAGALCAEHGALFHTDAVQAAGKVALPWASARPDYMSLAAHKVYGPKGVGALCVRQGAPVAPMLSGGGQERGLRASTEAVPLCAAFARACALAGDWLPRAGEGKGLRDEMEARLRARYGAVVHGAGSPRLPNTSFFSLPGAGASLLLAELDARGFSVSAGSACHGAGGGPPRVLKEMGLGESAARGALRVSLGRRTAGADVEGFLEALGVALKGSGA
jgi:cysteine desulfurase